MTSKLDEWIQTVSGRKFYPFDPRPEDIYVEDIAHALSNMCRFNGHCAWFYSVGQHSVHCSQMAKPEHKLALLLHDATEAFVADIVRPVKRHLVGYKEVEDKIADAVAKRFGIETFDFPELHEIDNRVLMTEVRDIMSPCPEPWNIPYEPYPREVLRIDPWSPRHAYNHFIEQFYNITNGRN